MQQHSANSSSTDVEQKVHDLVARERMLTFTALVNKLPDCRWIALFRALNHLEKQQVIQLTPLPWDYQICVKEQSLAPSISN